jgi:hypothetical protein
MEVGNWLNRLGLAEYIDAFRANRVDSIVLEKLTAEDLKEIGVGPVGHRRTILAAIDELKNAQSAGSNGEQTPAVAGSSGPERRHLTVVFCDLVSSTALATSMDPGDLREIVRLDARDHRSSPPFSWSGPRERRDAERQLSGSTGNSSRA